MQPSNEDSVQLHKKGAPSKVSFGLVIISTSRANNPDLEDKSYSVIKNILELKNHFILEYKVVPDIIEEIRDHISQLLANDNIQVIITSGGTGLTKEDVTLEALSPLFEKELTSFNPVFAFLSFKQVRAAAIMSRATAGIAHGKPIFCLPGSPKACQLAVEQIIVPEIGHILKLVQK
ncbi:MAG: molybdenum cofactor biosynthesis protein B [Candidatus Hodarchaeota archaeon]